LIEIVACHAFESICLKSAKKFQTRKQKQRRVRAPWERKRANAVQSALCSHSCSDRISKSTFLLYKNHTRRHKSRSKLARECFRSRAHCASAKNSHIGTRMPSTQRKSPRPKKNNNNCQMANYYIALHCLDLCFHYFYLLRIDGIKVSCNCIARKLRARRPAHFNLRISIRGRFGARRARARRRPGRQRGDLRPGGARPRVPSSARAFALSWARLLEAELSAFNMECDEIYGFSLLSFPSRGPAAPLSSIHYSVLRSRRGNCGDLFYFWH
jgi:hypothetical protein